MVQVLIVNTGSSSVRYDVFALDRGQTDQPDTHVRVAQGHVEEIGSSAARVRHHMPGGRMIEQEASAADHGEALDLMLSLLDAHGPGLDRLTAIGHRVVHGGERYSEATLVDDDVLHEIDRLSRFAPLHNPPALAGIRELQTRRGDLPQFAIFDTAFHRTIPAEAATYALPAHLTDQGVRRYGFHGTSHRFVTHRAAAYLDVEADDVRLVICHIGNGVSVTAVKGGRSVETSMGLTPLEGAVMGTRAGDVDPAVVTFLMRDRDLNAEAVDQLLNRESGLKGMCGESDMRTVRGLADRGDTRAQLALAVYAHRLRSYIGAYVAQVPGVQALAFTAGVGENDAAMRADVVGPLGHLGFAIDQDRNDSARGPSTTTRIDPGTTEPAVLVVPTDEGLQMAIEISHLLG